MNLGSDGLKLRGIWGPEAMELVPELVSLGLVKTQKTHRFCCFLKGLELQVDSRMAIGERFLWKW